MPITIEAENITKNFNFELFVLFFLCLFGSKFRQSFFYGLSQSADSSTWTRHRVAVVASILILFNFFFNELDFNPSFQQVIVCLSNNEIAKKSFFEWKMFAIHN